MNFRPCIDLHEGQVKQIVGKSLNEEVKENFISEKSVKWYSSLYKKHRLYGGHVIMLGQNQKNKNSAKKAIQAYPKGFQIGGGINIDNAKYWLDLGASAVIISSYMIENGGISFQKLADLEQKIGKDKIVVDLSCLKDGKDYFFAYNQWDKKSNYSISKSNIAQFEKYSKEILIHAIDVEGTKSGIDKDLVCILSEINIMPIVYAGGISSYEDINYLKEYGKNGIDFTIGSALDIFGGELSFQKVLDHC